MDTRKIGLLLAFALALVPAAAAAQQQRQTLDEIKRDTPQDALVGFIGVNVGGGLFGNDNILAGLDSKPRAYGGSILFWGRGLLAGEVDFCYNPKFFDELDVVKPGASTNMFTATANFVLGPTFFIGQRARIRPYGLIGGGLMRSKVSDFVSLASFSDKQSLGVVDMAGGLYIYPIRRLGFRGEFRYFKGIGANESGEGWGAITNWNYYRVTVGLALAF